MSEVGTACLGEAEGGLKVQTVGVYWYANVT